MSWSNGACSKMDPPTKAKWLRQGPPPQIATTPEGRGGRDWRGIVYVPVPLLQLS